MESVYNGPSSQLMPQSHFFYYNPEPKSEKRQHGLFTPHPTGPNPNMAHQRAVQDTVPMYSSMSYPRPTSSDSQRAFQPRSAFIPDTVLTPMASPRPTYRKPTILVQQDSPYGLAVDTDCAELSFAPSTPPLSCSTSAINSPPSPCEILPTPVTGGYMNQAAFDAFKKSYSNGGFSETLCGDEWNSNASPPLTPGMGQSLTIGQLNS